MRQVYVLMYMRKSVGPDREELTTPTPYAVFEDSITAERMKRDGDEIVEIPFFRMDQLVITDKALEGVDLEKILSPSDTPCKMTWVNTDRWGKDSSTLAPPEPQYPKVTCSKTVDEHTWRDRVD